SFQPRQRIAGGFTHVDTVILPGDMTYDGRPDIVLRDAASGRMVTLAGNGRGGIKGRIWWGNGWNAMHMVVSGRGWASPTSSAILAVAPNGDLFHYAAKNQVSLGTPKVSD